MITSFSGVKKLIDANEAQFFCQLQKDSCTKKEYSPYLSGITDAEYCQKDFVNLHYELTKTAEEVFGKVLLPTYIFMRVYHKGSYLLKHTDRSQCEFSLTLNLGSSDNSVPWPLQIYDKEDKDKLLVEANTGPGEGIFYKGIEYPHSRETPCPVDWYAQAFIHWVDKNGPYKSHYRKEYLLDYYKFISLSQPN